MNLRRTCCFRKFEEALADYFLWSWLLLHWDQSKTSKSVSSVPHLPEYAEGFGLVRSLNTDCIQITLESGVNSARLLVMRKHILCCRCWSRFLWWGLRKHRYAISVMKKGSEPRFEDKDISYAEMAKNTSSLWKGLAACPGQRPDAGAWSANQRELFVGTLSTGEKHSGAEVFKCRLKNAVQMQILLPH